MYYVDADRQETPRQKRTRLLRRICILAAVTLVVSVISIIIGIVAVAQSGSKFPYNAGGAMIAGISAFILAFCPFCMFCISETTGDSDDTTCGFDCCIILMVVWFSIAILTIPIGFGISGIYGVAACKNEAERTKVCLDNADSKLAFSVVTIILTIILFILALAIFFTCCCNASTFGMPLLGSYSDTSYRFNTNISTITTTNTNTNRRGNLQELAIQNALAESRRLELRPRSATINGDNIERSTREPSAPAAGGNTGELPDDEFYIDNEPTPPFRYSTNRYDDPPPSYEDVMKKDSTET